MAQQQRVIKNPDKNAAKTENIKPKDLKEKGKRIKDKADEIVGKIDEVLGDNIEEMDKFVKDFVQKGGE